MAPLLAGVEVGLGYLIENTMYFIFRYVIKFRLFQYLYWQFGRRVESSSYRCITCGLPDYAGPIDERIDDRLSDRPK
jgi:hypothetical protein